MKGQRGPKFPRGVGKLKTLLVVLSHPDGISEGKLIDEIKEKTTIEDVRGIKGHLGDLGPGRTVKNKWKNGQHYLIKVPSRYELKANKEKLHNILNTHHIPVDIENLPDENIWMPTPDFATFKEMASEFFKNEELDVPFMQTAYTRRMIETHVFNLIERKFDVVLSSGEFVEEIKDLFLKYPTPLQYLFESPHIAGEGEVEKLIPIPDFLAGTHLGSMLSVFAEAIPIGGKNSIDLLIYYFSGMALMGLDLHPKWRTMFDEKDRRELEEINRKALVRYFNQPDILSKVMEHFNNLPKSKRIGQRNRR